MMMNAYGGPEVLQLEDVRKPLPSVNEILIKVHATTVTKGDCELRSFKIHPLFWLPLRIYMGVFKPRVKIIGQEFAGIVESVGSQVTQFKPGDQVFGPTGIGMGAYREYICLPETHPICKIPSNFNMQQAATIPTGGLNALHFIRKANLKPGDHLLINGAGGSIGTYALQIARQMNVKVTCVDTEDKIPMLTKAGADHCIDFQKQDFWELSEKYDAVFDIYGNAPYQPTLNCIKEGGVLLLGNPKTNYMIRSLWTRLMSKKRVVFEFASDNLEDLLELQFMAENHIIEAIIDREYTFEHLAEAHAYVDTGRKKGNVVINF